MIGQCLAKLYGSILESELSVWAETMTSCSTRHAIALHESVLGKVCTPLCLVLGSCGYHDWSKKKMATLFTQSLCALPR